MTNLNYLIVEDNNLARMAITQIATAINGITLIHACESAIEAYNLIETNSIDFVLLDIEMPEMSGLELARKLSQKNIYVIFTTGKTEYAIDAFDTNVVDYILKPVSISRLIEAIDKLKELINLNQSKSTNDSDFFFIKDKSSLVKLMMQHVLSFDAMGDYVQIQTIDKKYVFHSTLKKIEEKLNPKQFIRVHRSHIVAVKHIDKIEDNVIYLKHHTVSLADTYKTALYETLQMF